MVVCFDKKHQGRVQDISRTGPDARAWLCRMLNSIPADTFKNSSTMEFLVVIVF